MTAARRETYAMPARAIGPGDVVAGKYRVDALVGAGAMGVVYKATHVELEEPVALKLMLPQLTVVDDLVTRFLREARAAAKLKSPHVTRVFDIGRLEGGAPYLVMELLDGVSLSDCIEARPPLSFEEAATIVIQACHGLEEAHARGIVHRDLKPANLFLARQPDGSIIVKVLDFGISKMSVGGSDLGSTETGALMGSPLYMSPEQMRSARDVDARSDVWAMGVILYKLLTGTTPYDSDGFGDLILDVHSRPPRAIDELRPDVPAAIREAVESCLERDRAARCPSVQELAEKLASFVPPGARRLDASLLATREPSARASTRDATDTVVVDTLREAAAAWPEVFVAPAKFKMAIAAVVEGGARLEQIHASDLYLALGCLDGQESAIAAFERHVMAAVRPSILRARARGTSADDATSAIEAKLLGAGGAAPKLAEYTGRVSLVSWVRAVAVRALLASSARVAGASRAPATCTNGDGADFASVVEEALRRLTPAERTALRFHVEDRLPVARLAPMLGADPATMARRIEEARRRVLAEATCIFQERRGLSREEAARACGAFAPELDASIRCVLADG